MKLIIHKRFLGKPKIFVRIEYVRNRELGKSNCVRAESRSSAKARIQNARQKRNDKCPRLDIFLSGLARDRKCFPFSHQFRGASKSLSDGCCRGASRRNSQKHEGKSASDNDAYQEKKQKKIPKHSVAPTEAYQSEHEEDFNRGIDCISSSHDSEHAQQNDG